MTFNYANLQATAERLIERFGKPATLIQYAAGDGGDPWDPGGTVTESTITLVETSYSMTNRDDSLIQQGDKIWFVSTAGESPAKPDEIRLDGQTYQLIDVQPLNPGGTDLMFEIHARR